jgi:hypothetical protein
MHLKLLGFYSYRPDSPCLNQVQQERHDESKGCGMFPAQS